jgi:hypothetical protein
MTVMAAMTTLVIILGLVVLALQRNHARQRDGTRRLAGSGTAVDRDVERVVVDLEAAGARRGVTFADRPGFSRATGTAGMPALRDDGGAWTLRTVFAAPSREHRPHRR